jgi:signal transduction histidine kinase
VLFIMRAAGREARLARLKSAFVSNVSHEMKTPIALIRLFAESIELGRITSEAKRREYIRSIRNECIRITRLIDNVLDFSKMQAHSKRYDLRPADPAAAIEEVLETYRDSITGAGFTLNVDIARPLPPVRLDANAFAQALLNLLDNAVKYSREIKEIGVRVYPHKAGVTIEVSDRGIGIPREEQERIFEEFYRVNTSLVHDTKGTGLGLSLTRHIIEAHGGDISVKSRPGDGSCFRISLPAMAEPAAGAPATARQGASLAPTAHR